MSLDNIPRRYLIYYTVLYNNKDVYSKTTNKHLLR